MVRYTLKKEYPYNKNASWQTLLEDDMRAIERALNQNAIELDRHKESTAAHNSTQITHDGATVQKALYKMDKRLSEIIKDHDGENTSLEVIDSRVSTDGVVYDLLSQRLDAEFTKLKNKIEREVNVADFGAVPGSSDSTKAFQQAIGDGNVKVTIPSGVYTVYGLKLPSNVYFVGQGKGQTILRLNDNADASTILLTNRDHEEGNQYISIEGITLDWNSKRQGGVLRATGGINSSCLTLANVHFGWIEDVEAKNAGLHGIDITAPHYDISEKEQPDYTRDGCRYISINNCLCHGYGDDGITTHYSEWITISNSMCFDPSGLAHPKGYSNSNGIEVDDGSKNVFLDNNTTMNNVRGVEVKAHAEWPAAQNVHITDHKSYHDIRSYDFRHIGHHKDEEPESTTAYDVTVTSCTAVEPIFNPLYEGLTPRALTISAYKNVIVNGFTAIGDPYYDYKGYPVIDIQYKARNVTLNNIKIRGFKKAGKDIEVVGGSQRADNVNISNVNIYNSAPIAIYTGSSTQLVNFLNIQAENTNGDIAYVASNSQDNIINFRAIGYNNVASIAGNTYDIIPNNIKGSIRLASTSGYAKTETSFIAASSGGSEALGDATATIATTGGCSVDGARSLIAASAGGSSTSSTSSRSAIFASNNSKITGEGTSRVILASQGVINNNNYSVRGGYGEKDASVSNTKWELDSMHGHIQGVGRVQSVGSLSDLAEYFESTDGKKIDTGYIVTIDNGKIRKANKNDRLLGVISETASFVAGGSAFYWNKRYLTNEFGGMIYETRKDEDGNEIRVPKESPDYDPTVEYIPRDERDEWHVVGLLGQVFTRIDNTVNVGDLISANNGVGTKSPYNVGFLVMEITKPYSEEKGYGVAKVLVK